tara:strand:- start:96 stop:365 length:270 start_codon:yes stop_codon:yes gene_type:complete
MLYYYTVYAKADCGYCARAINELVSCGVDHLLVLLDRAPDFHSHLKGEYDWETVPLIVKSNKVSGDDVEFIGGYDDLMLRLKEDGLSEE